MLNTSLALHSGVAKVSRPTLEPSPQEVHGFIQELVQINNQCGRDGVRGREQEVATWLAAHLDQGSMLLDDTELNRQVQALGPAPPGSRAHTWRKPRDQSTTVKLADLAAFACIGKIKDTSDLTRSIRAINQSAPGLRKTLKDVTASAIVCVDFNDDADLAFAIAKVRAASGTHSFILHSDHNIDIANTDTKALDLAAVDGVLGDLAKGEANIECLMGQFGVHEANCRAALQQRAVEGAAGKSVDEGMSPDDAARRHGF
ncbi:MAG TPA: hypothetical protein VL424_20100, partial [Pararobbsia sp.]|nr:hypothetical protein [Pararobbsia sp.]